MLVRLEAYVALLKSAREDRGRRGTQRVDLVRAPSPTDQCGSAGHVEDTVGVIV